jgi:hypothetical protein
MIVLEIAGYNLLHASTCQHTICNITDDACRSMAICAPEKKLGAPENVCGRPQGLQFHRESGDLTFMSPTRVPGAAQGAGARRPRGGRGDGGGRCAVQLLERAGC